MSQEPQFPNGPAAFVWTLRGAGAPSLARTLPLARAARAAIMRTLDSFGLTRLPDWLHHAGDDGDSAYWLPLDPDDDGRVEQIACVRPGGLGFEVLPGYCAGADLYIGEGARGEPAERWRMEPDSMGPLVSGGLVGPARQWISLTPFVAGRETRRQNGALRPRRSLEEQLRNDLEKRGLTAFGVETAPAREVPGGALATAEFDLFADKMRPPPAAPAAFVRLAFAEPVFGPLALGYGAHYGLGFLCPLS